VFHVRPARNDASSIPLSRRFDDTGSRRIEPISRAGRGEPAAPVRRLGVVEKLVLWPAPIDMIVFFRATVEYSRVAAGCYFPVQRQLEVAKLFTR
jgi:hypothetical protein